MAAKRSGSAGAKSDRFRVVRVLQNTTTLLGCLVHVLGGVSSGVSTRAIIYRCCATSVAVMGVFAVILYVMNRYEEVHGGKA
jgi:hypothetical protein